MTVTCTWPGGCRAATSRPGHRLGRGHRRAGGRGQDREQQPQPARGGKPLTRRRSSPRRSPPDRRLGRSCADGRPADQQRTGRLLITGIALSVDNLAVGIALGTGRVSLPVAVAVIGAVSVTLSLAGLELGGRLGARAGERGELVGGLVLIGVGAAVAAGIL